MTGSALIIAAATCLPSSGLGRQGTLSLPPYLFLFFPPLPHSPRDHLSTMFSSSFFLGGDCNSCRFLLDIWGEVTLLAGHICLQWLIGGTSAPAWVFPNAELSTALPLAMLSLQHLTGLVTGWSLLLRSGTQ